jgi:hypothetical protein
MLALVIPLMGENGQKLKARWEAEAAAAKVANDAAVAEMLARNARQKASHENLS